MDDKHVIIHQMVHGYKSGHKLLAASTEISDSDRRVMLNLSDYSGSGTEKGFEYYLTGYPLSSAKAYVFAKTWYADEMTRPGCVWTHSLLISYSDLWAIRSMEQLNQLFRRPEVDTVSSFSVPITFHQRITDQPNKFDKLVYQSLTCELYGSTKNLILLANSSSEYEPYILAIWNGQWPRLKRTFAFSTGSLSIRTIPGLSFDIQVMPLSRERSILASNEDLRAISSLQDTCTNKILDFYWSSNQKQIEQFMLQFGADIKGTRQNFLALVRGYQLSLPHYPISIETIIDYVHSYLSKSDEGLKLKILLIESLITRGNENWFQLIKHLVEDSLLSTIKWDFGQIIEKAIALEKLGQSEIVQLILLLQEHQINFDIFAVLAHLQTAELTMVPLTTDEYAILLSNRNDLETQPIFWQTKLPIQDKFFNALLSSSKTDWRKVSIAMMEAKCDRFAEQVYQNQYPQLKEAITNWLWRDDSSTSNAWVEVVCRDRDFLIQSFYLQETITNRRLFNAVLSALSPDNPVLKTLSYDKIILSLRRVNQTSYQPEVAGYHTLILTACYLKNIEQSDVVNRYVFQPLHEMLRNRILDEKSLSLFKTTFQTEVKHIGHLLLNRGFFSLNPLVPDWDNCEFLRRAFIAIIRKHDWSVTEIVAATHDPETFDHIIHFVNQLSGGRDKLRSIFKGIDKYQYGQAFHYNLLKRLVGKK